MASGAEDPPSYPQSPSYVLGEPGGYRGSQGGRSLGMVTSVPFLSLQLLFQSLISWKSKSWHAFSREETLAGEADKHRTLCLGGLCAREVKWEEPDGLWLGQAVALCQAAGVPIRTVPEKLGYKITGSSVNTFIYFILFSRRGFSV